MIRLVRTYTFVLSIINHKIEIHVSASDLDTKYCQFIIKIGIASYLMTLRAFQS